MATMLEELLFPIVLRIVAKIILHVAENEEYLEKTLLIGRQGRAATTREARQKSAQDMFNHLNSIVRDGGV